METIEQAKNRLESLSMAGKNGFLRGVLWSNHWIRKEDELPEGEENRFSKVVICKCEDLTYEVSAYYDTITKGWKIYPGGQAIEVTEWRPIERY
jgi:hypothetical protein